MKRRVYGSWLVILMLLFYVLVIAFAPLALYTIITVIERGDFSIGTFLAGLFITSMEIWGVWYSFKTRYSVFGKVSVNEFGLQVTVFSSTIFDSAWNDLADIGILIRTGRNGPLGLMFFSKKRLDIDPNKNGTDFKIKCTDSEFVMVVDTVESILIEDFMKYLPAERIVWIRDKDCPLDLFNRYKYHNYWHNSE